MKIPLVLLAINIMIANGTICVRKTTMNLPASFITITTKKPGTYHLVISATIIGSTSSITATVSTSSTESTTKQIITSTTISDSTAIVSSMEALSTISIATYVAVSTTLESTTSIGTLDSSKIKVAVEIESVASVGIASLM
jgi:hypothetical protein